METKSKFIPCLAEGTSLYSDTVKLQGKAIDKMTKPFLQVLDQMSPQPGQPFVIGDYGTADGGTSYNLITKSISLLRRKFGDNLPIQIIYEDLPTTDFKPVFMRAQGFHTDTPGYEVDYPNVYTLACGTSFYSPCLPSSSADVIISAHSYHRLSKRPCVLLDTIMPNHATGKERAAHEEQAKLDWETFLLHRSKELKSGGYLALLNVTRDVPREYTELVKNPTVEFFDFLEKTWRQMMEEGVITQEEFKQTTTSTYFRSKEEYVLPFTDSNSDVVKSGLHLESVRTFFFPCPLRQEYLWKVEQLNPTANPNVDTTRQEMSLAREHATKYVTERRASNERAFMFGLSDKRTHSEKKQIVDTLFKRSEELVALNPDKFGPDFVYTYLVIRKGASNTNGYMNGHTGDN